MNSQLNFTINLIDNATGAIRSINGNFNGMDDAVRKVQSSIKNTSGFFDKLAVRSLQFNQISQTFSSFGDMLQRGIQPGIDLNTSLTDLSAITGVVGEGLKEIEGYARESAKTFGGSAAQGVESYKLILSQLSPEIAKVPKALKGMGENIAILSKTMGGDTVAATEVLTTAMNQFQVSTEDPIKATAEMARMMNVMAAAAKEGSAELPQIKEALSQAGMAAKMAGVSFEETNAAIQVLDKAGKKGAEGGVALRNVMSTLSQGRFLPKDVQDELRAAGVDVERLSDKSLSLSERLRPLQGIMGDTALVTKLFGKENSNAALAIISGVNQIDTYSEAITGTNTAVEQAGVVMESYAEKQARVQAWLDNLKISLFNVTGGFSILVTSITSSLVPLAQIFPLLISVGNGVKYLYSNIGICTAWFGKMATRFRVSMMFMISDLRRGSMASIGFAGNMTRAALAVVRFGTIGVFQAIKGLGALVLSLITGGTTSAMFAGIASASFGAFATSAVAACKAVGVAIMNIPIIGWIAALIAGLIAVGVYLWNTSATFKAVLKGCWEAVKAVFGGIGSFVSEVLSGVWDLLKGVFNPANWFDDNYSFGDALKKIGNAATKYGETVATAFKKGRDDSLADSALEAENKADEEAAEKHGVTVEVYRKAKEKAAKKGVSVDEYLEKNPGGVDVADGFRFGDVGAVADFGKAAKGNSPIADGISGIGGAGGDSKIKNITTTIGSLISGGINIYSTNVTEGAGRVKDIVMQELVAAVNDFSNAVD